jgi:cobaltochelatase CobS
MNAIADYTYAPLGALFNLAGVPESASVPVRAKVHGISANCYAEPDEHYWFDPVNTKKLLRVFLRKPARSNVLLMGDTGAGKTSIIEQMATRLGCPVWSYACSGKTRLSPNLVGGMAMVKGETVWRDGPLLSAMRHGGIFLADEVTRMSHSEQMSLAKVLDGGCTITVPETGEVVKGAETFRFICTGNSGGYGDESGAYPGENVSSVAFLDRLQKLHVDYMPASEEVSLLKRVTSGKLPENIILAMVQLAGDIRRQFVGRGGDLRTTMSTRNLRVWALEAVDYKELRLGNSPIDDALYDTVLNGCPENDRNTIMELWQNWINGS